MSRKTPTDDWMKRAIVVLLKAFQQRLTCDGCKHGVPHECHREEAAALLMEIEE